MSERPTLVAGLGCRRDCSLDELLALLDSTLAEHGSNPEQPSEHCARKVSVNPQHK